MVIAHSYVSLPEGIWIIYYVDDDHDDDGICKWATHGNPKRIGQLFRWFTIQIYVFLLKNTGTMISTFYLECNQISKAKYIFPLLNP